MTNNEKEQVTRVAVREEGRRSRRGWRDCKIGRDIKFDTTGLESYCYSNWKPVIFDTLLLAAAIDFCDRIKKRPAHGWGREFDLLIPVDDPDRWSGKVSESLIEVLTFLTGDRWHINFHRRKSPVSLPYQRNFEMPNPSAAILPFSDGLDSLAVSALIQNLPGTSLLHVRLGSGMRNGTHVTEASQPFATVPYAVRQGDYRFYEPSARSRGFKFMLLSGVAAYLTKASEIVIPESGQGALGPVLVPVGHAYPDYRNHPRFAEKMAEFLTILLGHKIHFSFPRIWYTKGETLKEYAELPAHGWVDTRSCWQQSRQVSINGHRRQCGICAACMLRRMSVHAAGLTERPETYIWEDLSAENFEEGAALGFTLMTPAFREYAVAGTLHLDHLATLVDSPKRAKSVRREAIQIAPALRLSSQESETKLCRMLGRHTREWESFVKSLGTNSFVAKWTVSEK